jgi:hypothetical protein
MQPARAFLGILTAAALVAACGSPPPTPAPSEAASEAASPAPTASATVAPSATIAPSPSPSAETDVAAAFDQTISDPLWSPHITVKAVSKVGSQTIPMTGTIDVSLGTSHTVITSGQGNAATTEEVISTGAVKYTRQYGAWFKSDATSDSSLGKMITQAAIFTDAGVQAKGGQQLHHMILPVGTVIPATALGVPASATDTQVTLDGWADGEGNPVVIDINASWSQASGSTQVPVDVTMELTIGGAAQTVEIPTDDDLWAVKTSKVQHIQLAVPTTWDYTKGSTKKYDYFDGYDGSFIAIGRFKATGATLNGLVSYARAHLSTWTGLTGAKVTKASATKLAGVSARVLMIRGKYKGVTKNHFDIVALKGGYFYELLLSVPRTPTADDQAMWKTFLATFKFK